MMLGKNDNVKPFLNSINGVRNAFSSMEKGMQKVAKDMELRQAKAGWNKFGEIVGFSEFGNETEANNKFQVCAVNDARGGTEAQKYAFRVGSFDERVPVFEDDKVCTYEKEVNGVGVWRKGSLKNPMKLVEAWSMLVNTLCFTFPDSRKIRNERFPEVADEDRVSGFLKSNLGATKSSRTSCRMRKIEMSDKNAKKNDDEIMPFSILIGYLGDHLAYGVHKFDQIMQGNNMDILTGSLRDIFRRHKPGDQNGLFHNLKFARVGGVPSQMVQQTSIEDEKKNGTTGPELAHHANIITDTKKLCNQDFFRYSDSKETEFKATSVKVAAPVDRHIENVLKSALAGGLSCAASAFIMHPVDTVKTQVQASALSLPQIVLKIPQIGYRGLYRGTIPAVLGQFSSHGLRTGICEIVKFLLINVAPTMSTFQVESMSSFCGTILGTTSRIPSEVLKQRLQAGLYENVGEAIIGTRKQDGLHTFFQGTGATLCREIPFYVAGMGLYSESKKVVQRLIGRELEPWEIIIVGAISGGLAAVTTTPFDVIKTRLMVATGGQPMSMSAIALSILQQEGPLGLFKGAVPRFFWVAPLGAMNFAGYELARKALG